MGPNKDAFQRGIVICGMAAVIFRLEVGILLGCHLLDLLLRRRFTVDLRDDILPSSFLGIMLGLDFTLLIDSVFWWHLPLWPEASGFIYNIILGKSTDWGTSPFYFYFISALPRILFNPIIYLVCIPFAVLLPVLRPAALNVLVPNLLYVAIYSFQPHKEWRFIIYVTPPLLAVAAAGAGWVWNRRSKSFTYRMMSIFLMASTLASFIASLGMLSISRLNYPGAEALNRLHVLGEGRKGVANVHMDTLACMTGVTRFMEKPPPVLADSNATLWVYDKTEDEKSLLDPTFWQKFDFVLAEKPERVIGKWEVLDTVQGLGGVRIIRPGEDIEHGNDAIATGVKDMPGQGMWGRSAEIWAEIESLGREFTRGWWVKPQMEPKIRILRRQKDVDTGDEE